MGAVLKEFARAAGASKKRRILLVLDQAGWHVAKALKVPQGIHLFPLPAYTPELSPAEHLWPPIREELANRFFSNSTTWKKSSRPAAAISPRRAPSSRV
jgi:transposase